MNKKHIIATFIGTLAIVVVLAGAYRFMSAADSQGTPEDIAALATCLTEKGAKFYGAFWCPHCQEQKADFGDAVSQVPYIECSLPNSTQTEECETAGITGYPTWEFPGGERASGRLPLKTLAEATGCPVPVSSAASATNES